MNRKVLVLNQDYRPISVCTVQRAFLLVFLNKAELLDADSGLNIRTVSSVYPMPSVVRLFRYVRIPFKTVELSRQNVFKRDNHQCQYCGISDDLTIDHVHPRSKGGSTTWKNLVTACRSCNTNKGDFTPEEAGMMLRTTPYRPSFVLFLREFSGFVSKEWIPYLRIN
jgi:5-methylcytosine-specific restriction endonuclease McrA